MCSLLPEIPLTATSLGLEKRCQATSQIKGLKHLFFSVIDNFLLPTDADQLSSPLFLQLVCFCCQKSKYSHLALTLIPNLLVWTPKQPGCVLQGGAASSATPHHSSSFRVTPCTVQACNIIEAALSQQPRRAKSQPSRQQGSTPVVRSPSQ